MSCVYSIKRQLAYHQLTDSVKLSVALGMITLYNWHHGLIPSHFTTPGGNPTPVKQSLPISPSYKPPRITKVLRNMLILDI